MKNILTTCNFERRLLPQVKKRRNARGCHKPIFFHQRGDAAKRSGGDRRGERGGFFAAKKQKNGRFSALRGSIKVFFASCEKHFNFCRFQSAPRKLLCFSPRFAASASSLLSPSLRFAASPR